MMQEHSNSNNPGCCSFTYTQIDEQRPVVYRHAPHISVAAAAYRHTQTDGQRLIIIEHSGFLGHAPQMLLAAAASHRYTQTDGQSRTEANNSNTVAFWGSHLKCCWLLQFHTGTHKPIDRGSLLITQGLSWARTSNVTGCCSFTNTLMDRGAVEAFPPLPLEGMCSNSASTLTAPLSMSSLSSAASSAGRCPTRSCVSEVFTFPGDCCCCGLQPFCCWREEGLQFCCSRC